MFNFWNWKFNPFTQLFNPANVVGEQHIVAYDEDANAYGIRLHNLIELQGSLPFNTNINYSIYEDVTGGAKLTETPRTNPPDAGQFRVDYSANTYYSTSFIEFNSADNGLAVIVNYRQLGTVVKARYQLLSSIIFPANVGIEANLDVTDNVTVGIDLTVGGNSQIDGNENISGNFTAVGNVNLGIGTGSEIRASLNRIQDIGDPIDPQDATPYHLTQGLHGVIFIDSSQDWIVPQGVTSVLVELAGGGGGGGGGGDNEAGGSNGSNGNSSTFGALITAVGGFGGSAGGSGSGLGGSGGNGSGTFGQKGAGGQSNAAGTFNLNGGGGGGIAGGAGGIFNVSSGNGTSGSMGSGGGGGANGDGSPNGGSAGGGGSSLYIQEVSVTSGETIAIAIGTGGSGGSGGGDSGGDGGAGGNGYCKVLW